jgi:hypothetical protein
MICRDVLIECYKRGILFRKATLFGFVFIIQQCKVKCRGKGEDKVVPVL